MVGGQLCPVFSAGQVTPCWGHTSTQHTQELRSQFQRHRKLHGIVQLDEELVLSLGISFSEGQLSYAPPDLGMFGGYKNLKIGALNIGLACLLYVAEHKIAVEAQTSVIVPNVTLCSIRSPCPTKLKQRERDCISANCPQTSGTVPKLAGP